MPMNILVIGSGGREHALCWKLSQSPSVGTIYAIPGNAGTSSLPKTQNVSVSLSNNFKELVGFAVDHDIGLVVPGPEQPLVDGVQAVFQKVGIPVFGPSPLAARMEGSKAFSKDFMKRHNIPTASYATFTSSQFEEALAYTKQCGVKVVLKASGLAAGKGVLIPESEAEIEQGLREILLDKIFGDAGSEVVIEEYLTGPEISVLAFSDGYTIIPLPAAQDHKRIGEGDAGLNTGGMGAYAPAPVATPEIMDRIMKESLKPTIDGMRREGFPFVGLLFTGFMLTESGPKVLEYNVRFGDPETEALMLLLSEDTDLAQVLLSCACHHLDSVKINTKKGSAVSVVVASPGYPGSYPKGVSITLPSNTPSNSVVFHAGTSTDAKQNGQLVSAGGRVLAVSAYGETLQDALKAAYGVIGDIQFEGMVYRRDIAHRALSAQTARSSQPLTYAQAGVSVDAGNSLVEAIKPYVKETRRPGADGKIGGFGGVFDLKAAGYLSGQADDGDDTLLVAGTDGVGTKLKVALESGIHDTVGIDLVAMSVNDLIVQGAEPLFFLDYYGCANLDVAVATEVVKGIAEGCKESGCALVGGETAEMPGMYAKDDYDLAGFAVGAVKRSQLLPKLSDIKAGDVLIGLPSTGLHSNGFSLVRKIIEREGLNFNSPCPWTNASSTLAQALLAPTALYVKPLLPVLQRGLIKALSHITGGGFIENLPRALPPNGGLGCVVDVSLWQLPAVFKWLMKSGGGVQAMEMCRVWNCGFGMVLIVDEAKAEEVTKLIAGAQKIGWIKEGEGVEMRGLETWNQ
ncbi:hypothetical protein M408DRAFT_326758 [Serendipita vermifera MAFF 305830]|uniref:Phosphoribosylformylglycinamidine cyclo-ligase n=1 Tax=Serendipita vermifera MAFF 305830 TaxID=933852 RepID=A0A0C3BIW8_SERVB|nr:hypothetical protein M408DRAFT_330052 [Serendipita vermifera MAFF 305830]KIM32054.1 hypothetical protein M408DRAFT_326758 [Serendipita vermifera MAFF 305830]